MQFAMLIKFLRVHMRVLECAQVRLLCGRVRAKTQQQKNVNVPRSDELIRHHHQRHMCVCVCACMYVCVQYANGAIAAIHHTMRDAQRLFTYCCIS